MGSIIHYYSLFIQAITTSWSWSKVWIEHGKELDEEIKFIEILVWWYLIEYTLYYR